MNLAVVNEAVTEMNGVEHQFTEEEKNFVVQFAFRSKKDDRQPAYPQGRSLSRIPNPCGLQL